MLSWLSRTSWYYMEKLPTKVLELPFNGIWEGVIDRTEENRIEIDNWEKRMLERKRKFLLNNL